MTLRPDCARCAGLCCVALPFAASADFAYDKPAGQPCRHLAQDFRCGIHAGLRENGFRGCTVFDCFGAGQQVTQTTFDAADWRASPVVASQMFAAFAVMRRLHEMLWYLEEAVALAQSRAIHDELRRVREETEHLARGSAESLRQLDLGELHGRVDPLLHRASELVRSQAPGRKRNLRGADLMGASLAGADLRGANLRGALLIAADLSNADLREADLLGADLRDADLRGADLTGSIFLTHSQLTAAKLDALTTLPAWFTLAQR